MTEVADLYVRLRASTAEFTGALGKAGGEMETFASKAKASLASIGTVTAVAVGAAVAYSIDQYVKFEAEMTRIQTHAGASAQEVANMSKALTGLSGLGYGANDLANALYHVESAGMRGSAALDMLSQSAKLAQVGGSDLIDTTNAMIAIQQSNVAGFKGLNEAVGIVNATIGAGNMTMQDYAGAMGTGLPAAAATFGVSLQSVGAALALMTDQGVPAQQAATHLRMTLAMMAAPTKIAQKYLADTGMTMKDASQATSAMSAALHDAGIGQTTLAADLKKPDGLLVALEDLKQHMTAGGVGAGEQQALLGRAFGGGKSGAAVMEMWSNLDLLQQKYAAITQNTGEFNANWIKTTQTLAFQFKALKAQVQDWAIEIGHALAGPLEKFLGWINKTIEYFKTHKDALNDLAGAVMGVLVPALVAAGAAFVAAFWEPMLLIGALAALGAGFEHLYQHSARFHSMVLTVEGAVKRFVAMVIAGIPHAVQNVEHAFSNAVHAGENVIHAFENVWHAMENVGHAFYNVGHAINDVLTWISAQIAVFTSWWTSHSQEIHDVSVAVWTATKLAFKLAADYIVTVIKVAWDLIQPILSAIKTGFRVAWDTIRIVTQTVWHVIADGIHSTLKVILDFIGVILDLITGHWKKAWDDAKKLVKDAFDGILQLIKDWGKGAIKLLEQVGKDMIHGLVNGIKSMADAPVRAIKDIGHGITNAAKSVWKVFSPSQVFHEIGTNLVQGLANGMAQTGPVTTSLSKLTNAATNGTIRFGGGTGAGGSAGGGLTVIFQGPVVGGSQADADKLAQYLYQSMVRLAQLQARRNGFTGFAGVGV